MKPKICSYIAVGLLLGSVGHVEASEAKPQTVPLKITGDRRTKGNRLVIPRKFLKQSAAVSSQQSSGGGGLPMIIAGIAISLAVISLAVVMIRRKSRAANMAAAIVAVGFGAYLLVDMATADVAPPISEIPRRWKHVSKGQQQVTIEVVEEGDSVELVLGTYYRSPSRNRFPKPRGDGSAPPVDSNGSKSSGEPPKPPDIDK